MGHTGVPDGMTGTSTRTSRHEQDSSRGGRNRPLAAFLAWLFPGLGHMYLGQRFRGRMILVGTCFLVACGVLIGGIDVVDMQRDRLWFIAQAGTGPIAFVLDFLNQEFLKSASLEAQARFTSLGNLNSTGTLYIALAGLMNVVVMIDALAGPDRLNDSPTRRRTDG